MLHPVDIELIRSACHSDPFSVLGPHREEDDSLSLRVFLPGAVAVSVLDAATGVPLGVLEQRHEDGFFEATLPALSALSEREAGSVPAAAYHLQVTGPDGNPSVVEDPYRFPPALSDTDVWLLGAGSHLRPHEALGATPMVFERVAGTRFAVWAPTAVRVSVVGDFNEWDGRRHAMRLRYECGVWEIFVPGVAAGALYKYEIRSASGELLPLKADPVALQCELPPATASVVAKLPSRVPGSAERRRANAVDAPISIYQLELARWRRHDDHRVLGWDELSASLPAYVFNMGFTHLALLDALERDPEDAGNTAASALYAPTARHGDAAGFRRFIERCQSHGVGVIMDWSPTHLSDAAHGLQRFDGTQLYERSNGHEPGRLAFDLSRTEVRNFVTGNALYWLERHAIDGLRIDAVASLLGDVPGAADTAAFLTRLNEVVHAERPQALMLAGAAAALPGVARPASSGGLGFDFKSNAGWAEDTLRFMARDPAVRHLHLDEIAFGLRYAFDEHFVLPLATPTAGGGSLLQHMPGERVEQFANLRAYLGFMFGHPGKKLMGMGSELAQPHATGPDIDTLDWTLLADRQHEGVQRLCHDLNHLYAASPALFERDADPAGFEWLVQDTQRAVVAFVRRGRSEGAAMLLICNFSAVALHAYRLPVPGEGLYRQRLNTDAADYGRPGLGTGFAVASAEAVPCDGRPYSLALTLPPLATVMIEWKS